MFRVLICDPEGIIELMSVRKPLNESVVFALFLTSLEVYFFKLCFFCFSFKQINTQELDHDAIPAIKGRYVNCRKMA